MSFPLGEPGLGCSLEALYRSAGTGGDGSRDAADGSADDGHNDGDEERGHDEGDDERGHDDADDECGRDDVDEERVHAISLGQGQVDVRSLESVM